MHVIEVRIVVDPQHVDLTSEYGLTEKAFIALSHAVGNAGLGNIVDSRRVSMMTVPK